MTPSLVRRPDGRSRPARLFALVALPTLTLTTLVVAPSAAQPVSQTEQDSSQDSSAVTVEEAVVEEVAEEGTADFWVSFDARPDLSPAFKITDWTERGEWVYQALTEAAEASQAGLVSALSAQGTEFESFWVTNAVFVRGGDQQALETAQHTDGVSEVLAETSFELPDPIEQTETAGEARPAAVEWGIADIGADRVWSTFGVRGEDIVVGNIDTGVQFDHPALVGQYRGNIGAAGFEHDYHWWDPTGICGPEPCDTNGHGTHTMGTMVGDDSAGNQIGAAPGARWIAAKGCEGLCPRSALVSSGQFMLAPTDLSGENPRPDLRPHVVNNSWGNPNFSDEDPYYNDIVDAWTAAGIFGVFANGNEGAAGCDTTASPADYPGAWGVGAYAADYSIAEFSSRGPGGDDVIKPDIAAPGVDVRSSYPRDRYALGSGTSMAAPHQAAAVALMWSAAPALAGDVDTTRQILQNTAVDTDDTSCGGTPGDNNVWGEGRLDAFTAVQDSPRGGSGTLTGVITAEGTDTPVTGALVTVTPVGGGDALTRRTDANGVYTFGVLLVGDYDLAASAYGYGAQAAEVTIVDGQSTIHDFVLQVLPTHQVSGTVIDDAEAPVEAAEVWVAGSPSDPVVTDEMGRFSLSAVPEGEQVIEVTTHGGCLDDPVQPITVGGAEQLTITAARATDDYGYTCRVEPAEWIEATTDHGDVSRTHLSLPFAFPFYETRYTQAYPHDWGFVNFLEWQSDPMTNLFLPAPSFPNAAIYPFWDDHRAGFFQPHARLFTATVGEAPNRKFVIEWRDSNSFWASQEFSFQVVLHEQGDIVLQYHNLDSNVARSLGDSATVGIENHSATTGLRYSFNHPVLSNEQAIRFSPPPRGILTGTVTDTNDQETVAREATITARRGDQTYTTTTAYSGSYELILPAGTWTVTIDKLDYATQTRDVTVEDSGTTTLDAELSTAELVAEPVRVELVPDQEHTVDVPLANAGEVDASWSLAREIPGTGADLGSTQAEVGGTTSDLGEASEPAQEPGEVITSIPLNGTFPWGIGFDGNPDDDIWISHGGERLPDPRVNAEYAPDGTFTGRSYEPAYHRPREGWQAFPYRWPGSMAFDDTRGWMCQLGVLGGRQATAQPSYRAEIYCWDGDATEPVRALDGPWSSIVVEGSRGSPPKALAYDPEEDVFYIAYTARSGAHEVFPIRKIAGFSHEAPGTVMGECLPWPSFPDIEADPLGFTKMTGLAYDTSADLLWVVSNSQAATYPDRVPAIIRYDFTDCSLVDQLPFPDIGDGGRNGGDIAVDPNGDLWVISVNAFDEAAYLVESGVEVEPVDVPWLSMDQSDGTVPADGEGSVPVTVDTTGLELGIYSAQVVLASNNGREPRVTIPIEVSVVPVTFDYLRGNVEAFEADGDVTMAGAMRLLTALDQAERHHDRGADGRAVTVLERFKDVAADPRFVPGETARDALVADTDQLIAQLRDTGSQASTAGGSQVPGLESALV